MSTCQSVCISSNNKIDVTDSPLTHKRLAFSSITPLFVDRFGRSLQFYHLQFDKEAISDGFMADAGVFKGGEDGLYLSDFRELSFSGPCGTCFLLIALSLEITHITIIEEGRNVG